MTTTTTIYFTSFCVFYLNIFNIYNNNNKILIFKAVRDANIKQEDFFVKCILLLCFYQRTLHVFIYYYIKPVAYIQMMNNYKFMCVFIYTNKNNKTTYKNKQI